MLLLFIFSLAILVYSQPSSSTLDPISINYVSSLLAATSASALYGSINGGTALYIHGGGFDPTASNNLVFVGQNPCNISAKGVTMDGNTISCFTTLPNPMYSMTNLPITVAVNGKNSLMCSSNACKFTYSSSYTPTLQAVYPRSGAAFNFIKFYGIHRITDLGADRVLGDIVGLYFGSYICSRFDIIQPAIAANSGQYITCSVAPVQPGGFYNITEWVTPGIATNVQRMNYGSIYKNLNYQFIVMPNISQISSHFGGSQGLTINISGTGFSRDSSVINVSAGNNSCSVLTSTQTLITCVVQPDVAGNNYGLLSTNSTNQTKGFLSGGGLYYSRYDLSQLSPYTMSKFLFALNSSSPPPLLQSGIKPDLQTPDIYGSYYGQVFKGYFVAPTTGTYTFRALADDYVHLYLSPVKGSKQINYSKPLIYSESYPDSYVSRNYYYSNTSRLTARVQMSSSDSYYIQVYHMNGGGPGWFQVSVEVPSTNPNLANQAFEVNQLNITQTVDPQIFNYTLTGANAGTINFKMVTINPKTLVTTYNVNVSIPFNATASTFANMLNAFTPFQYTYPIVNLTTYDYNGIATQISNNTPYTYTWTVTISKYRAPSLTSQTFITTYSNLSNTVNTSTIPTLQYTLVQAHSPPISGTFQLYVNNISIQYYDNTIGGYNSNLPYSISAGDLSYYLQQFLSNPYIQVDQLGVFEEGAVWIISFVGMNMAINTTVIANLQGGRPGTLPSLSSWDTRSFSTNLLVEPISSQYLFTYSSLPNVLVMVNGVISQCNTDCSYQVNSILTPIVNNVTLIENKLNINITDSANIGYTTNVITVVLDNQKCIVPLSGTLENFNCTLPDNIDSTPVLRAGSYQPIIQVKGVGIATYSVNVVNITIPLTLNNVTPSNSAQTGGLPISIMGYGLPTSLSDNFSVMMCGVNVTVLSVTNTNLTILSAACANYINQSINITVNGIKQSILYNYSSATIHTITSISPQSASPVLKGNLQIQGTGYGVDPSLLQVYLMKGSIRVYQLNILQSNDTYIKAFLGGGLNDTFTVSVFKSGLGYSIPSPAGINAFKYQLVITSISPSVGSINGGTIIAIHGRNFSPKNIDNQIYIGSAVNWLCPIISANSTTILCTTPAISPDYNTLIQPVVVVGRVIIQSTCDTAASCTFTYDNSTYPTISPPAVLTYSAGNTVTLTGSGLINPNFPDINPIVKVGGINATLISATNSQISFVFPTLSNGTYSLLVQVYGIGYASPTIKLNTLLIINASTPATGSIVGNIVNLTGNGIVPLSDTRYSLVITSSSGSITPNYTILSYSPILLRILIMGGGNNLIYTLTYTFNGTSYIFNYKCLTSSTPVITMTTTSPVNYGSTSTILFTRTGLSNAVPESVFAQPVNQFNQVIGASIYLPFNSISSVNGGFVVNGTGLHTGNYSFLIFYSQSGYGYGSIKAFFVVSTPTYVFGTVISSYHGGQFFNVSGNGISPNCILDVAGVNATVYSISPNQITYRIPPFITDLSQTIYNLVDQTLLTGTPVSDTKTYLNYPFDGKTSTAYYSTNSVCYVGYDFGPYLSANVTKIRYYPYSTWTSVGVYLIGSGFYGSNDNTTWTLLYNIDNTVHTGFNIWRPPTALQTTYRYIQFRHNTTSNCRLASLQIYGRLYQGVITDITSNMVDVHFNDGINLVTWASKVDYQSSATPKITNINPKNGNPSGGYNITISGTGFTTDPTQTSIVIDQIPCIVQGTPTTTQIICLVGKRINLPAYNSFDIYIGQNIPAMMVPNFTYVSRWSDINTWGGDLPPMKGDSVYVPRGMVLYVDQSTPNLQTVVVEGSIIFADEGDYFIETGSIIVNFGVFQAGTEAHPYQHQLTFLLHGSYYDKQLPGFGNKVIGCHCCKFDMYGTPRYPTWTELDKTINPGDTQITLTQTVDWNIGQSIVVASTSFDHNEAEQKVIIGVDTTRMKIQVDQPFIYKHLSVIENFGANGDNVRMKAEVGLLTRNIKVMGDSYSVATQYGAHIMMHGPTTKGLVGHIAYTEVTQCGQPQIVGRYCIHFHLNGDVSQSYVIGNSVHQSYARVLTIHGVHYLTVQWNVGYRVQGHNFFLEDGIETFNVIEDNLAIGSLQVWVMLQTDISVASFWITNPMNTFRRNHAAGSDFYGIWYEIKPHPDGPSATNDICPPGLPIIESSNSVAHSNTRFGLRIFKLFSSTYPCLAPRNDKNVDPWSANPSIQNVFSNFTMYSNNQSGLLGQHVGNTIFRNFTIVDSGYAAVQFQITNFSKQFVILQNAAIIGQSVNNGPSTAALHGVKGIITPRTDGFMANNIRFYKFPVGTIVYEACSNCDNPDCRTTTGKSSYFSQISYSQINGSYMHWKFVRRQIYYDLDGTLTSPFDSTTRTNATLIPYYPHNDIPNVCVNSSTSVTKWDTSQVCNGVAVRSIAFGNAIPELTFLNGDMKIYRLNNSIENISTVQSGYSDIWVLKAMVDKAQAWAAPFVTNYIYDIWWLTGVDFTHMAVIPSQYFNASDPGVILRVNYTAHRELFDITNLVSGKLNPMITPGAAVPDPSNCTLGDYYFNTTSRYLYLCISGVNKTVANYVDVNGITCRFLCPVPGNVFTKQPFIRLWSNVSQWPNQVLPNTGDNVTINGNWTIIMDMDPAIINNLTIDGDVIIGNRTTSITAHFIYIRAGSLTAGSPSTPFGYNLTFTFLGNKGDFTYFIDNIVNANKYMVVTGKLNLYGNIPGSVFTKLSESAQPGDTSITVDDPTDWVVGNTLGIGPSFSDSTQEQKVTITAINGSIIQFTPALQYPHFGGLSPTIKNTYGTLDMRAAVAVLDRNIKFVSGSDPGWGFRVLIYAFIDQNGTKWIGSTNLLGVEFVQGGQYDTQFAALSFKNLVIGNNQNLVKGCSLRDCGGYCMYLANSYNVTIDTNSFFIGHKFIIYAENMFNYAFINNFMAGALVRPSMLNAAMGDDVCCYNQFKSLNFLTDNNTVANNLCQGAAVEGFVFPHTPCQFLGKSGIDKISSFVNNTAGSSLIGFGLNVVRGFNCLGGEGFFAYGNTIGFIANPPGPNALIYKHMMMGDNGRGITFRNGNDGVNNTAFLYDSWINPLSRPNCSFCYGDTGSTTPCHDNYGIRMYVAAQNGQQYPLKFGPQIDTICKQEAFDAKAFFYNVTFENFNQNYTGLSACGPNVVFKSHPSAFDFTASHHLTKSPCINCDNNSYGYFIPPSPSQLGWLGGCGLILCTGRNNYLIRDHDGEFLGFNGVILANNSIIGGNTTGCNASPLMNGHICARQDMSVLNYQSVAPDFNKRIMWPVNLTFDGGSWTSSTNGFRQWEWNNKQPMNLRLARFVSIIQLYQVYNMTFASQPPSDMLFEIQKSKWPGNSNQWVVIKIYYPVANAISVSVNGVVIPPILSTSSEPITNRTSICGANKYFYQNSTIHFVVTGDANCQVRVTLTSSVQITSKLSMDINKFFDSDGVTAFIDRVCAFLNIVDTSRVKVVGVTSGSTEVTAVVTPSLIVLQLNLTSSKNANETIDNSTYNPNATVYEYPANATQIADLNKLASSFIEAATNGSLTFNNLNASVVSASAKVIILTPNGTIYVPPQNNSNKNPEPPAANSTANGGNLTIIIIAIVGGVVGGVVLGVVVYFIIKYSKESKKKKQEKTYEQSERIEMGKKTTIQRELKTQQHINKDDEEQQQQKAKKKQKMKSKSKKEQVPEKKTKKKKKDEEEEEQQSEQSEPKQKRKKRSKQEESPEEKPKKKKRTTKNDDDDDDDEVIRYKKKIKK